MGVFLNVEEGSSSKNNPVVGPQEKQGGRAS